MPSLLTPLRTRTRRWPKDASKSVRCTDKTLPDRHLEAPILCLGCDSREHRWVHHQNIRSIRYLDNSDQHTRKERKFVNECV